MSEPETPTGDELVRQSYQRYFESGFYDRRYPGPNLSMWRRIRALLMSESHLIDFGCGSGRYLFQARGAVGRAAGFDVSPAALALVAQKARAQGWDDLHILGPEPEQLVAHVAQHGQADVVLCLFGVLGHIARSEDRQRALGQIRAALKPGSGRLVISVPNIARRFRAEQRRVGPGADGLVQYRRGLNGDGVLLNYQLFDETRLSRELGEAGFTIRRIGCESVLPESWLLKHACARWLDSVLTPLCPTRWSYGIYAEASV